jgi:antitoxin component of MazEF toxin-antitoxin module
MSQWTTKIQKTGDLRVITLPADLLLKTQWAVGEELILTVEGVNLHLSSNRAPSLAELMAQVPEGGLPSIEELEGLDSPIKPVGREV